jgi:hypothetical protein
MHTYIHAYIHAYTVTYMRQCNAYHYKHTDKILSKQKEDRQPPEHRAPHARTNIDNLLSHGANHSNKVKQSTINNYDISQIGQWCACSTQPRIDACGKSGRY